MVFRTRFRLNIRYLLPYTLLLSVFLFTTGFTFKPVPEEKDLVWPVPPDPPKIAYVTSFSERKDMGFKKGFFQKLKEWIVGKEEEAQLLRPTGVFSDGKGVVYVTDTGLQVVHVFDFANKTYRQVFKLEGKGAFDPDRTGPARRLLSPIGVAADQSGRLFVSDSLLKQVFVFGPKGELLQILGDKGWFQRPTGLTIDEAKGLLYVVDTVASRITAFDIGTAPPAAEKKQKTAPIAKRFDFGARGGGDGEFNFPTQIVVDKTGRLFVTDSLNFRVQQFDPTGKYLGQFGKLGDTIGTFSKPKGIAIDDEDHLYVVDNLYDTIQIFDSSGKFLLHFGGHGGGPGGLWLPVGIHIDPDHYIFVADTYNQRIQVFRFLGDKDATEGQ